jgi:hypothetical protein
VELLRDMMEFEVVILEFSVPACCSPVYFPG